MQQIKVLLVQLASNGDCLLVTTIAKQIKEIDYPGCHLTWLIGSKYVQTISNNPHVDSVITVSVNVYEDIQMQRDKIDEHVINLGGKEKFDQIFITDFTAANYKNWFGTTRSSLFRSYPHKIKTAIKPVIYLTDDEKNNVATFCEVNGITPDKFNILFECSPQSYQSSMSFDKAKQIAEQLSAQNPNINFILTSQHSFSSTNPNVIDGSVISWRENAELANYCQLLVGCSSGISWLCTSNWTKPIKNIQIINPNYFRGLLSASMKVDFKFWGLPTDNLIELDNPADDDLKGCIALSIHDFKNAKRRFNSKNYDAFLNYQFIKEANISVAEKTRLTTLYLFSSTFFWKSYRTIKPKWFAPKRWMQNSLNFLNPKSTGR